MEIEIDDSGIVSDLQVTGGCHGNLQGIAALCRGRKADEVARTLRGIRCGKKATSCPDQIAAAIEQNINN
ncbi:MAG: TIGR03905 family TSCPD domain-containing protein [Muribaculaceae bacterium]|nr:TIGR03905 family TSCPD domain-containing protein [Muribaculaceae bacterium]